MHTATTCSGNSASQRERRHRAAGKEYGAAWDAPENGGRVGIGTLDGLLHAAASRLENRVFSWRVGFIWRRSVARCAQTEDAIRCDEGARQADLYNHTYR